MTDIELKKIETVADAEIEMEKIGVHPGGILIMATKALHRVIKIKDVETRAANIIKQEMLACGADAAVSKGTVGSQIEKTDVLVMGTIKQINHLIRKLKNQPFGLNEISVKIEELI